MAWWALRFHNETKCYASWFYNATTNPSATGPNPARVFREDPAHGQTHQFRRSRLPGGPFADAIGDGWSLLIVRDAFDGLRRFGEFQKNLGMAKNILSDRLRTLTAHGILEAAPASDGSAYQEYVLTEKGRGCSP